MEPRTITIHDCDFSTYMYEEEIIARIVMLAEQIEQDYAGKNPLCFYRQHDPAAAVAAAG